MRALQRIFTLIVTILSLVSVNLAGELTTGSVPPEFVARSWSTEDGLPHLSVTALAQTRDGYLWAGTLAGLARFDGVSFKVFTPENCPELPKSRIGALFEGGDGTLFIATERGGGLVSFRGGQFERLLGLRNEEDEIVACMPERLGGSLFIARSGAVWRWDRSHLAAVSTNREFYPVVPRSVCQDALGRVWMLNRVEQLGRLLCLDHGRLAAAALEDELAGAQANALVQDQQGHLWLGTSRGLAMLGERRFERVALPELEEESEIRDLAASRDGGLWLCHTNRWQKRAADGKWAGPAADLSQVKTRLEVIGEDPWGCLCLGRYPEGLVRVSLDGRVARIDRQKGLPGATVACYQVDHEGNEWVGLFDGGLVRLQPRRAQILNGALETLTMPVYAICEDHEGAIWAGTSSGGIYRFQGSNVTRYLGEGLPLTDIWSLCEDSRSNLWVGTTGYGVYQFQNGHFVSFIDRSQISDRVDAIYEDRQGRVWLGHLNGLDCYVNGQLTRMDMPWHSDEYEVLAITEDRHDRLWLGTRGAGLFCLQEGRFTSYTSASGLPNNLIWSLYVDAEDTLWIGTADGGLSRLHEGKFANFTVRDGLADNTICHVAEDQRGRLWFSSPHGVFRVEKKALDAHVRGELKTFSCTSYNRSDGMPASACTCAFQPSGCLTKDGRFLVPTVKGIAVMDTGTVDANPLPPAVVIEDVLVDGRNQVPRAPRPAEQSGGVGFAALKSSVLVVPPGKRRLEIRYTALSYSAPEKVRFKYRMENLESDWTDAGAKRVAVYPYLPHGRYRFHVQACNNDGVWNSEGAILALSIEPQFWQTWWFLGAALSAGGAGVALTARGVERARAQRRLAQEEQLRAVDRERARIARDFHDGLGASLTRMIVLSELVKADRTQPEEVEAHATKIGRTAQEAVRGLGTLIWAVNPRHDTLDGLVQYISQYAYDFMESSPVRCHLDFPTEVPALSLLAEVRHNLFMIVEEALNNVLKHSRAVEASVRLVLRDRTLELAVEDNGCGFQVSNAAAGKRSGLGNMRQRATAIGASLQIESRPGQGTTIVVRMPCEPKLREVASASNSPSPNSPNGSSGRDVT